MRYVDFYEIPWPVPERGFYAEDLDRFRGLPLQSEMVDGGLFVPGPRPRFHSDTTERLASGLQSACPADLEVFKRAPLTLTPQRRVEPDVLVAKRDGGYEPRQVVAAEVVVLVVEVMSPDTEYRDRDFKPRIYGEEGIRHLWRVEDGGGGHAVVYVYELDVGSRAYAEIGIYRGNVKLERPFGIDLWLEADPAGGGIG